MIYDGLSSTDASSTVINSTSPFCIRVSALMERDRNVTWAVLRIVACSLLFCKVELVAADDKVDGRCISSERKNALDVVVVVATGESMQLVVAAVAKDAKNASD